MSIVSCQLVASGEVAHAACAILCFRRCVRKGKYPQRMLERAYISSIYQCDYASQLLAARLPPRLFVSFLLSQVLTSCSHSVSHQLASPPEIVASDRVAVLPPPLLSRRPEVRVLSWSTNRRHVSGNHLVFVVRCLPSFISLHLSSHLTRSVKRVHLTLTNGSEQRLVLNKNSTFKT